VITEEMHQRPELRFRFKWKFMANEHDQATVKIANNPRTSTTAIACNAIANKLLQSNNVGDRKHYKVE
jgi:hypothetical protein